MKQLTCLIVALAGATAFGPALGQEHGSRESSGVIKMAPDKPPAGHVGARGTAPVPGPAREHSSSSEISGFCASANRETRDANNELSPASEGRVIGKGRLRFHSAPNTSCRVRNSFIVPGDVVIARRRHGEWLLIDYVSRDGVMHSAWVDAARIALRESAARP